MRKYFSEDYVIPSPKLRAHQKKRSSPEIEVFFSPKVSEELGHFRLIIQRSNLDGGTLTLDGGTRPPYNLSTELAYSIH